jgi:hypothetical protein
MEQTSPRADSLEALGLQRFLDTKYYKYGGYVRFVQLYDAGASNAEIAREYSEPDRPLHRQSIRPWRAKLEQEREEQAI